MKFIVRYNETESLYKVFVVYNLPDELGYGGSNDCLATFSHHEDAEAFRTRKEKEYQGVSMRAIFKYPIDIAGNTVLLVPTDFELLDIGEQRGGLVAWGVAEIKDSGAPINRMFEIKLCIRGTGRTLQGNEGDFIKTVQMANGLVWHIFWRL